MAENKVSVSTYTPNTGATVLAKALRQIGVEVIFGIVGIPVVEVAEACIGEGIRFIGCRNEQTASYAAGAYGYLTGKPGVCLVVSGPGVIHALSGLYNSQANCWPMILIGGSCETTQVGMGSFQELDQVAACQPYVKYSCRPIGMRGIPDMVEKVYLSAIEGRPGPTYLDFPADLIRGKSKGDEADAKQLNPSRYLAEPKSIQMAVELINNAQRPLIIVGKGAAYSRCEKELLDFITLGKFPVLPSPMGKGVIPDNHPQCVGSARSQAMSQADLIVVLGARLNWMFQFGKKFHQDAKLIHVDIEPSEIHRNRPADVALIGDLPLILSQLNDALIQAKKGDTQKFLNDLVSAGKKNAERINKYLSGPKVPMNHHVALSTVQNRLDTKFSDGDYVLVSEGARTMDVTRLLIPSQLPRRRLDAGTLGVMGVGLGYAIASQLAYPDKRVVAIMGDSAFGFSGMDLETCIRYRLPIIIVVINNGGIYHGLEDHANLDLKKLPSFALTPGTRYDILANMAPGAKGWIAKDPSQLTLALDAALETTTVPCIINVLIDHRPASEGLYWLSNDTPAPAKL